MAGFGGGFSFGAPATNPIAAQTPAAAGINFGLGSNTAQGVNTLGVAQTSAPSLGGFSFGASSSTAGTALGGTNTTNPLLGGTMAAAAPALGGYSFATAKPTGSVAPMGMNPLGAAVAPPVATSSTIPASGGFFAVSTPAAPTASTSAGGLFATPSTATGGGIFATSATATGGGLFATPSTVTGGGLFATPSTVTGGGLFATPATATGGGFFATPSTVTGGGFFATPSATTNTIVAPTGGLGGTGGPVIGLGGNGGLGGTNPPTAATGEAAGVKTEGKPGKETPLPLEIFATIAAFESFKGVEKAASEANLRQSAAAFHKLGDDCQKLRLLVTELATLHASLQHRVNGIKEKIVKDSNDVEMARRTHNTPAHVQGDNTAPEQYFAQTLESFEVHMLACRERIAEVEKCLMVGGQLPDNDAAIHELVRRQHDGLQVAASHVYTLHTALLKLHTALPSCPDHLRPKPLFRPGVGDLANLDDHSTKSAVPKESGVVRTCFDMPGGGSRLGNFQVNMAKARALSLNPAPPPTQPLVSTPFGSSSVFNTGSGFGLSNSFGNTVGSTTGAFGAGVGSSAFGTGAGMSLFNSPGTSAFGTGLKTNFASPAPAFGIANNNTSYNFNNNNNTPAGSLFSSTFGQSNKLFKT